MYTIKQAAARTGVSVPLLRAWERRYGIVEPARTAARYRLYDDAALARIQAMRRMVEGGWSPSAAAAALLRGQVAPGGVAEQFITTNDGQLAEASGFRVPARARSAAAISLDLVDAAIAMDADAMERILDEVFALGTFEHVVDDYLMPALDAVGDAWSAGRLSVAGEHATSHAVLRRLAGAFQAAGRAAPARGAVLVGMPPGAHHELGALAFAVAAKRAGLPVLYLGPDLPADDWVSADLRVRAKAAVIGSVLVEDAASAAGVARALRAANARLPIAFGGASASRAAATLGEVEGVDDASAPSGGTTGGNVVVLGDGLTVAVEMLRLVLRRRG